MPMASPSNRQHMAKQNVFWERLACYDSDILQDVPKQEKRRAKNSGRFLLLIFCLSLIGNSYAFFLIFGTIWFSIAFALFCSLFFLNIYRLILTTTGSHLSPTLQKKRRPWISYLFKGAYILFFAIISSKPLEILIFSFPLQQQLAAYESTQIDEFRGKIDSINGKEIALLQKEVNAYQLELAAIDSQLVKSRDSLSKTYLLSTQAQLTEKLDTRASLLNALLSDNARNLATYTAQVSASHHFGQRLKILFSDYPKAWYISITVFLIFVMPYFYRIRFILRRKKNLSVYERQKADIDDQIIRNAYTAFKEEYRMLLEKSTGLSLDFYEYCEDPPYNTVRRQADKKQLEPSGSFRNWLINSNE